MRKLMRWLVVFCLVFLTCAGIASAETENGYPYSVKGSSGTYTAVITAHSGAIGSELVIPDTLGGYTVPGIDSSVFKGKITSPCHVVIPDTVTSIGFNAFQDCTGLMSIVLPESVTAISAFAFSGCKKLTGVTLPAAPEALSPYMFEKCSALSSLQLPQGLKRIGGRAFYDCSALWSLEPPVGWKAWTPMHSTTPGSRTSPFPARCIPCQAPPSATAPCWKSRPLRRVL